MGGCLSHNQIEDAIKHIAWIFDTYDRIIKLPSCYKCKKSGSCEYEPPKGEPERINCPLFIKRWRSRENWDD